jgi:hypothetical protein
MARGIKSSYDVKLSRLFAQSNALEEVSHYSLRAYSLYNIQAALMRCKR